MNDLDYTKEGIKLWLNNRLEAAEEHFKNCEKSSSIQIEAGYAFLTCVNSIISYEIDKIEEAQTMLIKLEKKCANDIGWLKTIRTKLFLKSNENLSNNLENLLENLEKQIILADTQVCLGILTFLTQEFRGYMKGSWLLRKSWKIYQKTYTQLNDLYKNIFLLNDSESENPIYNYNKHGIYSISMSSSSSSTTSCEWSIPNSATYNDVNLNLTTATTTTGPEHNNCNSIFLINRSKSTTNLTSIIHKKLDEFFKDTNNLNDNNSSMNRNKNVNNNNNNSTVQFNNIYINNNDSNLINVNGNKLTKSNTINFNEINNPSKISFKNLPSNYKHGCNIDFNNSISATELETIKRLMGAVCFGYGIFHLAISLVPPNILKFINIFGFDGDRKFGVSCLKYCRLSNDVRSPLATLALLWYLTDGSQLFGLEDKNNSNDLSFALTIIDESIEQYPESSLFLIFKGRIQKIQSNIVESLRTYENAYNISAQIEIKLLCLHEIAWCHLIELNFRKSLENFYTLARNSKFSKSFYFYITLILHGACGNFLHYNLIYVNILNILSYSNQKDAQMEKFIVRRIEKLPKIYDETNTKVFNEIFWKILTYEMLYLWNTLINCNLNNLNKIIEDCSQAINDDNVMEPMVGLSKLLLGCCESYTNQYENAINSYTDSIDIRNKYESENFNAIDLHITAFAHYELADVLFRQNEQINHHKAKELLQKADSIKNYDFENRLSLRIHQRLKDIKIK